MTNIRTLYFLLFLSFCAVQFASAQTLTVNAHQLNFGNAYENAPDSLQLTITNTLGRDVTVSGIRFYNIYGAPAFSASSTYFIIADGSSQNIWIKFSPRHNIFHNSELVIENDGLRGDVTVDLIGQGKFSDTYYNLTENVSEENLKTVIKTLTGNNYISLGYNDARDEMFETIDNKRLNGQGATQNTLECIYTGREAVGYTDRTDCQTNYSFNTEHTLPQSLFSSAEPMKSDLHHLFPTDDDANGQRADNPFGVVNNPTWTSGGSKSDGSTFEPRDAAKGIISRALFYFVLRYQNYNNFLTPQESILRTWFHTFPPDNIEKVRNADIYSVQRNKNPFVDYPVLLDRITSITSTSNAAAVSTIDLPEDTIILGTIAVATPVTYTYNIVNTGNTAIHLTGFALTHSPQLTFATPANDTTLSAGESLPVFITCNTTSSDSIRGFLSFHSDASGNANVTVPVFVNDNLFSGINEISADVLLSPNPSHDIIHVAATGLHGEFLMNIYNLSGQLIKSDNIHHPDFDVDVRSLQSGIYFLHLENYNGVINRKLIVN